MRASAPAGANRGTSVWPIVAVSPQELDVFALMQPETRLVTPFTLRDVHPQVSIAARLRLKAFAERPPRWLMPRVYAV